HFLRIALFSQDLRSVLRVLVEGRMDLVVEIVQERDDPPELLVFVEKPGVPGGRGLDRKRMAPQGLALRVLGQRLPGAFACRFHGLGRLPRWPRQPSSAGRPRASPSRAGDRFRDASGRPETRTAPCRFSPPVCSPPSPSSSTTFLGSSTSRR